MQFDIAFEGGGAKGAAFAGAMMEFEARGHTSRRFVGTSSGAISALLVAAGLTARELLNALTERLPDGRPRLVTLMDVPEGFSDAEVRGSLMYALFQKVDLPLIPEMAEDKIDQRIVAQLMKFETFRMAFSFIEKGGLYTGLPLVTWLEQLLEKQQSGLGSATFEQFFQRTGRDLSLVVSDTTRQEMLVLNHRTAPDCPVVWGVRMSVSAPFVWQEVEWKAEWGRYRGREVAGHLMIDGGVLSNFPIDLLASNLSEVVQIMGDTDPFAVPNLGLLIDETLEVEGSEEPNVPTAAPSFSDGLMTLKPIQRISRLIETMMNAHDRVVIETCMKRKEICRLPARGYRATAFGMSGHRLTALVNAGRRAMQEHFDNRDTYEKG